ncbi:unnamed protein product [Ambrosiozyma monospora]|uniref:Unnamed protein product n=1 Tax=Ambrosiozyma monospora TaxID=43982 RepID=A0ACB5SRB6_AMBMO|nr:unnamed protein product [Ambrosiozyma monospora]
MSDSIDRVFVKAISIIKTLSTKTSRNELSRPPLETRTKLYGLYKQATEGDAEGLTFGSPKTTSSLSSPSSTHQSSDTSALLAGTDQADKRKWEAWKAQEGLNKTEAKRQYIICLIDAMKQYAVKSNDAKELLNELEFLWDQVKDLPTSSTGVIGRTISRSESPAISLYRLASHGGSNSNLIRPASRGVSNSNVYGNNNNNNNNTLGSTVVENQQRINDSYMKTRSLSGNALGYNGTHHDADTKAPISGQRSTSTTGKNIQFLKWQNDINLTLSKLSQELSSMNKALSGTNSSSSDIFSHSTMFRSTSTPTESGTVGNGGENRSFSPSSSSSSSNKNWILRALIRIKRLIVFIVVKLIKGIKMVLKQAAINSVIILVLVGIAKKLKLFDGLISAAGGPAVFNQISHTGSNVYNQHQNQYQQGESALIHHSHHFAHFDRFGLLSWGEHFVDNVKMSISQMVWVLSSLFYGSSNVKGRIE